MTLFSKHLPPYVISGVLDGLINNIRNIVFHIERPWVFTQGTLDKILARFAFVFFYNLVSVQHITKTMMRNEAAVMDRSDVRAKLFHLLGNFYILHLIGKTNSSEEMVCRYAFIIMIGNPIYLYFSH